jgi:hypothetical protein
MRVRSVACPGPVTTGALFNIDRQVEGIDVEIVPNSVDFDAFQMYQQDAWTQGSSRFPGKAASLPQ